jgi:hypothetical protein
VDAHLAQAFASWLQGMRWDFFATPTFRYPTSQAVAMSAVKHWLASKGPRAYAAVAYERGPLGGRLHCHVLVGGVGRSALQRQHLLRSWRHGMIKVEAYRPHLPAARYVCEYADDPEGLEILGSPQRYRPRRRGTRGGRHGGTS